MTTEVLRRDAEVLRPNPTFSSKYAFLFEKTTPAEEATLVKVRFFWFAIWWLVIAAYASGLCSTPLMVTVEVLVLLRWFIANHDCLHMRSAPKTGLPFRLFGAPPLGFLPVASTFGDNLHQHLKDHHLNTKSVLDVHDPDSWWSQIPLPLMLAGMLLSPSDMSVFEVAGQYVRGPRALWPERIGATIVTWAQYAVLHQMGVLLPALTAAHLGSAATFIVFHGLLHRPSFYRMLVKADPSGRRRLGFVVDGLLSLACDPAAWVEIKFHDAHHSHGTANQVGCTHIHYASGRATAGQIEDALVAMADEGLFIDARGKPVSALETVGHKLGARRSHSEPTLAALVGKGLGSHVAPAA